LTSWYGRFYSVPNGVKALKVGYTGSNSLACSQSVSLWNWVTGTWLVLDSRSVGSTPLTVSATPSGTLADYVSNLSGNGDVAVRVRCTRTDLAGFSSNGDQLKITYTP
jgi:hypothetical protein